MKKERNEKTTTKHFNRKHPSRKMKGVGPISLAVQTDGIINGGFWESQ